MSTMVKISATFASFALANESKDLRVGNKYRIGRKIGSGSFGDIYLGNVGRSWELQLLSGFRNKHYIG